MSDKNKKQATLEDFFELVERPTWQAILHSKIKKYGMQIWDIDVSILLTKLLDEAYKEENLKHASLFVLICSILLKSKSRRIGLKELEKNIKEDVQELENIKEIDTLNTLLEEPNSTEKYNELLELESKLKSLFYRRERNIPKKTIKEFRYAARIESYFKLKSKLLEFFSNKKETTYSELLAQVKTNNSLVMGLLLLNHEEKIKMKQRVPYGKIIIKKV